MYCSTPEKIYPLINDDTASTTTMRGVTSGLTYHTINRLDLIDLLLLHCGTTTRFNS